MTKKNNEEREPDLKRTLELIRHISIIINGENITDGLIAISFHLYHIFNNNYPEKLNKEGIWRSIECAKNFHDDALKEGFIKYDEEK